MGGRGVLGGWHSCERIAHLLRPDGSLSPPPCPADDVDADSADISQVPEDALRNVEADTYWCMSRLLDGIQVSPARVPPPPPPQPLKPSEAPTLLLGTRVSVWGHTGPWSLWGSRCRLRGTRPLQSPWGVQYRLGGTPPLQSLIPARPASPSAAAVTVWLCPSAGHRGKLFHCPWN